MQRARERPGSDQTAATPFVGRAAELQALREALHGAMGDRRCRLVTIVGQPGVGKSRLVAELHAAVETAGDQVLWRRALPRVRRGRGHHLLALAEIVKATADILDTDDRDTASLKLSRSVAAVVDDPADAGWVAAMLAPLIGLATGDQGANRDETFSGWRRFLATAWASCDDGQNPPAERWSHDRGRNLARVVPSTWQATVAASRTAARQSPPDLP